MIEKMISEVKCYLPLKILEVKWNNGEFRMYDSTWNFNTLSVWRISIDKEVVFGCYDERSTNLIKNIKGLEIIDIHVQDELLKIDPVFILSNGQRLEIFSTNTYEPWVLQINQICYTGTPA